MKIKQLKNGMYTAVVSLGFHENGKRHQERITAKSKWEVEKLAEELVERRVAPESQHLTVEMAMKDYVKSHSNLIEKTTMSNYNGLIRNRLKTIHNIKINRLQISDIQNAINTEAGKRLSRRTIKNGVDLLKSTLIFYDINLNFNKLKYPKDKPKPPETLPEINMVFSALKDSSIEVYCYLAFNGCMRIGELLGLKFQDIDYKKHTVHIHRTQIVTDGRISYRDYCKTPQSIREINIDEKLCEKIKLLPHKSDDEYIVPLTRKALYSRYARIMKRNGLPTSFHLMRKISASYLHAQGLPDKYILYLGGWSTDNVLKSVYEKTFVSEREIANKQAVTCFKRINEQINQK